VLDHRRSPDDPIPEKGCLENYKAGEHRGRESIAAVCMRDG